MIFPIYEIIISSQCPSFIIPTSYLQWISSQYLIYLETIYHPISLFMVNMVSKWDSSTQYPIFTIYSLCNVGWLSNFYRSKRSNICISRHGIQWRPCKRSGKTSGDLVENNVKMWLEKAAVWPFFSVVKLGLKPCFVWDVIDVIGQL